ncbi:MAG: sensor histidine kinase [SAR324 cluster bacterium]|nr:sensor histidine kinase [SAR324 cluster bacterium]
MRNKWCRHDIFSIPIFSKIFGIVALSILILGVVMLYVLRDQMNLSFHHITAHKGIHFASVLAYEMERIAENQGPEKLKSNLLELSKRLPEIPYIAIRDADNHLMVQSNQSWPSDELKSAWQKIAVVSEVTNMGYHIYSQEVYDPHFDRNMTSILPELSLSDDNKEQLFRIIYPLTIAPDQFATLEIILSNSHIDEELSYMTGLLITTILSCAVLTLILSFLLTWFLIKPVYHLVEVSHHIAEGDLSVRATVYYNDEIGQLAVALNRMTEKLLVHQGELQKKEEQRNDLFLRLINAQEAERKSIARELHDQFGQSLSSILLRIRELLFSEEMPDPSLWSLQLLSMMKYNEKLHDLEQITMEMMDHVKTMAWDMRPPILDDYGLGLAVNRYVQGIRKLHPLTIDYQYEASSQEKHLPDAIEVSLYRVIQEAFRNILRHSQATQVSMVIWHLKSEIVLMIEDNGIGFDTNLLYQLPGKDYLGIIGMQERIQLINGTLRLDSGPDQGTVLKIRVPLPSTINEGNP